jgi:hypothetical protein
MNISTPWRRINWNESAVVDYLGLSEQAIYIGS